MRRTAIAGVGMTDVGVFEELTWLELAVSAAADAIRDSGVSKSDIDGIAMTPVGYVTPTPQKFVVQRLAEYLEIPVSSMAEVDCGGASSLAALRFMMNEIAVGRVDVGLVVGSHSELVLGRMRQEYADEPQLVRMANGLYGSYDSRFGVLSPIGYYAMCQQRYMMECGVTPEQVAELPVVLRDNAAKNPRAMYRDPITVDDVLSSKMLSPPIHLLESCPISHGAGAAVLVSEERARELAGRHVVISGYGEAHDDTHFIPRAGDMSRFPAVERSGLEAYRGAGIKPEDVDVAEVYGAFAGPELMTYEELGFFGRGEAPSAVAEGKTRVGCGLAINTSGGRLSLGHAAYATPLFEVFEVVTQLRGEAGVRQAGGARVGLVQAEHGMVNGSIVFVMEAV